VAFCGVTRKSVAHWRDRNPKWSDTEDRYLLKLFRDYVFHSVDEDGDPVVDFGHVVSALNKVCFFFVAMICAGAERIVQQLDAGVPEKTILTSRADDSMLVVSYAEMKNCIGKSFNELCSFSKKGSNPI